MQDRLYILKIPSYQKIQIKPIKYAHTVNIVNVSASDLETLWNFRLGHVSNKCIDVIMTKFPFVKYNKSIVCDVCHFTKQNSELDQPIWMSTKIKKSTRVSKGLSL